jgi:hypothetical protein
MGMRIWTLIAIDVLFCFGLLTLLFLGSTEHPWSIVSCIALIAYVTWSIKQLMQKANESTELPK